MNKKKILNMDFLIESEKEREFLESIEDLNEKGLTIKSELILIEEVEE